MDQQQATDMAKELSIFCKMAVHTLKISDTKRGGALKLILPAVFGALLAGSTPDKGEWWDTA